MNVFHQRFSNHNLPNGYKISVERLVLACYYSKKIKNEKLDINSITIKDVPFKKRALGYLRSVADIESFVDKKPIVITDEYYCLDGRHRFTVCKEKGVSSINCIIVPSKDIDRFIYNSNC